MNLIERIEGADGPSRELFQAAFEVILPGQDGKQWLVVAAQFQALLNAEAWLSAAEMLVPEGWNWMAGERDQGRCRAYVNNGELQFTGLGGMRRNPQSIWHEVVAATPALALCAAALRTIGDTHDD